jgi:lipoprotein LprG
MTPRPRSVAALVVLLLAGLAGLTGCSSGSGGSDLSPTQTLAAAKHNLDRTRGVHIVLSTGKLPSGVDGLLHADGVGTHAPAFKGDIKVATSGFTADAAVVAVAGQVYAKLPFTTRFAKIDPARYGAPDPATMMDPKSGLSSLLTAVKGVKEGQQQRDGRQVLSTYTGKVPGRTVAAIIPSASASGSFHATFTVTDSNQLDKAVLTGPFYPHAGNVTYTIAFDQYGVAKNITAP